MGLPYVGCGVAASAVGMDKALMKAVFRGEGLPVVEAMVARVGPEDDVIELARRAEARFGLPVFVKPANGGSSVGVGKARGREELATAITEASRHDRKLVIEPMVEGREVECAILGNAGSAEASPVGEIRHYREFYDYEAKYLDPRTEILAPTDLGPDIVARVQELALKAYTAVDGAGMSRVDFFLCPDGLLMIDEINTIPGFTPASMYPRLWAAAGVSYTALINRLVALALER
jgi:D-alanine-D-alanine ligase